MSLNVYIKGSGKNHTASVDERGQLITGPLMFSNFYNATAGTAGTAVEVVPPKPNKDFIITALVLYANKNVGATDATVEIFEASSSGLNSGTNIFKQEMVKQTSLIIPSLNILVTEGKWIRIVTDDDDVFCNLSGYYVDAVNGG